MGLPATASRKRGGLKTTLTAYSPDLNPIEQMFAKLKAMLRKVKARTQDALWDQIGKIITQLTPTECRNYIVNSGYAFE